MAANDTRPRIAPDYRAKLDSIIVERSARSTVHILELLIDEEAARLARKKRKQELSR